MIEFEKMQNCKCAEGEHIFVIVDAHQYVHAFHFFPQIPHGAPDNEAVRIFVAFNRLESAIKGMFVLNL